MMRLAFYFLKKTLSQPLILIFFKGQQNKKENHVLLLIWKRHVCKNRVWIRRLGYLPKR